MSQFVRRLARVADSPANYTPLIPDPDSSPPRTRRFRSRRNRRFQRQAARVVPQGHVPVYVGDEMKRFVVSAKLLNRPVFVELLKRSAQEYGYGQQGVLKIPCQVPVFERVLESLTAGNEPIEEIISLFSDDEFP